MLAVKKGQKCFSCWFFIYLFTLPASVRSIFFDWFWTSTRESEALITSNGPFPSIPFEYNSEDEKFLEEASKYTDLMKSSSLDICQHRVILQLKTSCHSMTEEELSKMSVNLLNCQSEVDGRKIFPCSETMSLKECTKDMDANIWNAYHLMNNRARAVCLAARRIQFQVLSEMTVNKLMTTAHDQIKKMTNLLEGQEKLETLTLNTLNSVERGNTELIKQQDTLKKSQIKIQDFIAFNLEQLTTEKALIAAGNKELAKMAEIIKKKLDEANQQLMSQSEERMQNHNEILKDIEALQIQAHDIFQQVGSNTDKLLAQHQLASQSYNAVIENLSKINDTVHYLLKLIGATRNEVDERLLWIQSFLDGTGNHIERLLSVTFHVIYLLFGMLFASFLNFSNASRALLAIVVPLNLFVTYNQGPEKALDFYQITIYLFSGIIGISTFLKIYSIVSSRRSYKSQKNECITSNAVGEFETPGKLSKNTSKSSASGKLLQQSYNRFLHKLKQLLSFIFVWGKKSKEGSSHLSSTQVDDNFRSSSGVNGRNGSFNNWNEYTSLRDQYSQSTHSRVNEWLQSKVDYPRAGSPSSTTSGSPKFVCSAVCRSGKRCKNTTYLGRSVCHRHLTGDIMDT